MNPLEHGRIESRKKIFLAIVAGCVIYSVMMVVAPLVLRQFPLHKDYGLYAGGSMALAAVVVLPSLCGIRRKMGWQEPMPETDKLLRWGVVGLLCIYAMNYGIIQLASWLPLPEAFQVGSIPQRTASMTQGNLGWIFIGVVMAAPMMEELVFRGICFRGLRSRFSFWIASLIPSVIFGSLHGGLTAVCTFAAGMIFCYLYEKTRWVGVGIGVHVINNFIALYGTRILGLGTSHGNASFTAASVAGTLLAFLLAAAGLRYIKYSTEGYYCQNNS